MQLLKTVVYSSGFTCLYMTLLWCALLYNGNFYNIGKRTGLLIIGFILAAELINMIIIDLHKNPGSTRDKQIKHRKVYYKNKAKGIILFAGMILVYYSISIILGASFLSEQEETLMFSLLLAAFTVIPACLNLGSDTTILLLTDLSFNNGDYFCETIKRNISFTLLGAWLGSIVIPLDWDRPWQVWPIPCSLGATIGYSASHIVTVFSLIPQMNKIFAKKTGKYDL